MENVAEKLYNILGTKFDSTEIKTLDSSGKETTNMEEVEMFSFDFVTSTRNYGPVVILISAENNLEIYYGDNTSRALDPDAKKKWEDFIEHMSTFARSNRLGFSLKHTTDLKYDLSKVSDITESYRNIFESYYGTNKTSYKKQGNAKIIIKHSKQLGEEDARFRNISSLFIENADGERFKLPFKKLAGARAMARHVTEGGNPYDLLGVHISEMVRDINTLGGFVRRAPMYEDNEEAQGLVETGRQHYNSLRQSLKQLAGKRGYQSYKESWEPSAITEQERDIDTIRGLFTERSVDSRIEEALPLLARLQEMAAENDARAAEESATVEDVEVKSDMQEVNEFEEWANKVLEGDRSESESIDELHDFFGEEQPLGIDALNVSGVIQDTIGDEHLLNILAQAADKDSESDARPIVAKWISDHNIDMANKLNLHGEYDNEYARDFPRDEQEDFPTEGLDHELDADSETKLNASVNKDVDNYVKTKKSIKESTLMKNLTEYVKEVTGAAEDVVEPKQINESKEVDEPIDLKELMERTNYLLKK